MCTRALVDDEEHRCEQPETDATPAATGAAGPEALLAGTFALYEDGQGGYVLVTDTVQHGTDRKHIPAALVKMATGGGIIGRKLAGMFG